VLADSVIDALHARSASTRRESRTDQEPRDGFRAEGCERRGEVAALRPIFLTSEYAASVCSKGLRQSHSFAALDLAQDCFDRLATQRALACAEASTAASARRHHLPSMTAPQSEAT
jgi:hypothetical protein